MMFSKKVKHTCTLGGGRGGSPIKTVVRLEKISCYLTKHKDTIRKFRIIKIILKIIPVSGNLPLHATDLVGIPQTRPAHPA